MLVTNLEVTPASDGNTNHLDRLGAAVSSRALWTALILSSNLCLSLAFACATPFPALATLAALKLKRRHAVIAMGLVWLSNQAIGYGFLGYPWTWDSAAWGVAIGLSAGFALVIAGGLCTSRPAPFALSLPFVGAFSGFELSLYLVGFILPGSGGAFAASVVWRVFLNNAVTLAGLMFVYHAVMLLGSLVKPSALTYRTA